MEVVLFLNPVRFNLEDFFKLLISFPKALPSSHKILARLMQENTH